MKDQVPSYLVLDVTPQVFTGKSQKTGKDYSLTECYAHVPGLPYPEKITAFNVSIHPGKYQVPYSLAVQNKNIVVVLDFKNAVLV